MVSDDDSKTFLSVVKLYSEVKVEKLNCVGQVQKRIGKHLLNLKARTKGKLDDRLRIEGRGHLTENKIKTLQKYYGFAIRQNTLKTGNPTGKEVDVAIYSMKTNIIAISHHFVKSQDLAKHHRFFPRRESSRCKWKQDAATGTATYKDDDC